MNDDAALERGAQRSLQSVLKVKRAIPVDDVRKQVAVQGGVLCQQGPQVKGASGGGEFIETYGRGLDQRPVLQGQPVFRVRPGIPDMLENHSM